jgi:hypothetical protein
MAFVQSFIGPLRSIILISVVQSGYWGYWVLGSNLLQIHTYCLLMIISKLILPSTNCLIYKKNDFYFRSFSTHLSVFILCATRIKTRVERCTPWSAYIFMCSLRLRIPHGPRHSSITHTKTLLQTQTLQISRFYFLNNSSSQQKKTFK